VSERPNPRRAAVALRYERADGAPKVTATGRILDAAHEHGLPVREDPDLVEALAMLDLGAQIPPELYAVIAEVLAWAYRANADYAARAR
jgi:flagellar biosynthesis protein